MTERLPMIQISVVRAKQGAQRNIRSTVRCQLCNRIPEDDDAVLRIQDFAAGPGIHETVLHTVCVQALLDATADDDAQPSLVEFIARAERFAAN